MPYNFHVKRLFSANCRPRPLTINPQKLNRFWFVELRFQRNLFCLNTQSLGPRQLNLTHKCNKISKIDGNFTDNTDQKAYSSYRLTITITHIRKNVFCQMKAYSDVHSFCIWGKPSFFAFECGPLSSMWVANWKVFCEEHQKQFFAFISTLTSKQELLYYILQKHFQHCVICNEFRNEAVNMSKNVQKLFSVTFQMVSQ